MSDKKHIDRLFQESFKDFEAVPSDAVWENIEAQLNQKKKKHRVIPIWWRYAGAAALLLLLLTIGINYFNNYNNTQSNQIVDTEDNISDEQKDESNDFNKLNKSEEVVADDNTSKDNSNQIDAAIATTNSEGNTVDISKESTISETSSSQNENESKLHIKSTSNKKLNDFNSNLKTENKMAVASYSNEEKSIDKSILNEEEKSLIDKNNAKDLLNSDSKNNGIAQNNTSEKEVRNETAIDKNKEDGSLTIEDAIDKTKDIIEKEKLNRWSIAPNAAPVYFNTLGEGSSIDSQFNSNSKTGELNMSYGISASYAVTKKLSIRSGVNRVNLGYNTNNVIVFQSVGVSKSSALQNVDTSTNNSSLDALIGSGNAESLSIISGNGLSAKGGSPESFSSNTSINQALGYIEVPLEIKYNLLDKKVGINVISGFSSFFLSDNKIYSESDSGSRTFLGEATNLNKVSYSANFGLGLNSQVSKKIDLNLEPMFKYQMNTFNNTSGDFQPFFIGVYSGFAIKF
jgi:hypothetical protein